MSTRLLSAGGRCPTSDRNSAEASGDFRELDERFINSLMRNRLRPEGRWKSRCHGLSRSGLLIGPPCSQPFLSFPEGRTPHASSRDQSRVHYLASSSESRGCRKRAAHRARLPGRDGGPCSILPVRCEADWFPILPDGPVARPAK